MDTPTAKAIRASIIDRAGVGDEVALQMHSRAIKMGLITFGALSIVAIVLLFGKKNCKDCGKEAATDAGVES